MDPNDILRFKALDSGSEVRSFFTRLASQSPILSLAAEPAPTSTEACHVCKGGFRHQPLDERLSRNTASYSTHRGCHALRAGWSTPGIMFGFRLGFWIHMEWLDKGTSSWRAAGLDAFLDECGHELLETIELCRVDAARLLGEQPGVDSYLRYVRAIYIEEREKPKWESLGHVVPEWNEDEMTWLRYKKDVFGPAYDRLPERPKRKPLHSVSHCTGGLCALCGGKFLDASELKAVSDHIVPHVKGGDHTTDNLQPLHDFCNNSFGSVGAGDIPLSLMIGRWMMMRIEDDESRWMESCLSQFATRQRANARRRS